MALLDERALKENLERNKSTSQYTDRLQNGILIKVKAEFPTVEYLLYKKNP